MTQFTLPGSQLDSTVFIQRKKTSTLNKTHYRFYIVHLGFLFFLEILKEKKKKSPYNRAYASSFCPFCNILKCGLKSLAYIKTWNCSNTSQKSLWPGYMHHYLVVYLISNLSHSQNKASCSCSSSERKYSPAETRMQKRGKIKTHCDSYERI